MGIQTNSSLGKIKCTSLFLLLSEGLVGRNISSDVLELAYAHPLPEKTCKELRLLRATASVLALKLEI